MRDHMHCHMHFVAFGKEGCLVKHLAEMTAQGLPLWGVFDPLCSTFRQTAKQATLSPNLHVLVWMTDREPPTHLKLLLHTREPCPCKALTPTTLVYKADDGAPAKQARNSMGIQLPAMCACQKAR